MKRAITISLLIISLNVSGQEVRGLPKQSLPKADTVNYALVGKNEHFILLYKALITPGDVTPNQLNSLIEWVDKGRQKIETKIKQ